MHLYIVHCTLFSLSACELQSNDRQRVHSEHCVHTYMYIYVHTVHCTVYSIFSVQCSVFSVVWLALTGDTSARDKPVLSNVRAGGLLPNDLLHDVDDDEDEVDDDDVEDEDVDAKNHEDGEVNL